MLHFDDPWACDPALRIPDPCVTVTLPGGIEMQADPSGADAEYTLAAWDGWRSGPEIRGGAVPWENADHGVWGDIYFQGLSIQLEGLVKGQSANHYAELEAELGAVLTRPRVGLMRVDEEHLGLSRQIEVARGGRPSLTQLTDRVGRYSVQLQSASSLKLGVDQQSATITASGVQLRNAGTADAPLVVDLNGPLTRPGLSWPGGAWSYEGSVPAGSVLRVDMERRIVRDVNSAAHSRNLAAGTWLSVPPGDTLVKRTGTGSGNITARWRSAWH